MKTTRVGLKIGSLDIIM